MNAEDAIRLLGHGRRTFTRPEAELVTGVIREQAARIAELEDDNHYQEESLRMIYLVSTGEDMSPGQTGAVAGKAIERMQRDKARIAELEDKLRWRDCKTEPPTDTTFSLFRSAFIEENQMCFVWVDSIYLGNPSHPKYGYPAIEWRPIK